MKNGVAGGIPIEVKTNDNVHSKSLGVYRDKYEPDEIIRIPRVTLVLKTVLNQSFSTLRGV